MRTLFLLAAAAVLHGQEPAKSVCGMNVPNYTANITLLQVACVDFEAMRKIDPSLPWPQGKWTQVLVHVRAGEVVKVTVDGVSKLAELIWDPNYGGRYLAMVQFEGIEGREVAVKVYAEVAQ